jgi:hypothetical protein
VSVVLFMLCVSVFWHALWFLVGGWLKIELGSVSMIYIPSFIKIGSGIQTLFGGIHKQTPSWSHKPNFILLYFVQNKESRSKCWYNNLWHSRHQLMLKCWNYNPETRPTFKYCLDVLEELKSKSVDVPLTAIQNGHYVGRTQNGKYTDQ